MKIINLDINSIVAKNLYNKRNQILYESLYFDNIDNDIIQEKVKNAIHLINEGYSIDEISDIFSDVKDFDFKKMFTDSLISTAKEFGIKWLLDYIGFNPTVSTYLAQGLADLPPRSIFLPWKNKQYCQKYLPGLLDSILEVIVRYFGQKMLRLPVEKRSDEEEYKKEKEAKKEGLKYEKKLSKNRYEWVDLLTVSAGNITGDLIRKSNTSEGIANSICPIIHK